jgi:acetylglutamate kinase
VVDLGLVGEATGADVSLLSLLLEGGCVPVIASLGLGSPSPDGLSPEPEVLNVNADGMACALAGRFAGCDLVIAGTTPGVLDAGGRTIPTLDIDAVDELIASGTATAGMIAKLSACRAAIAAGVARVRLVDGRALAGDGVVPAAAGTTIAAAAAPRTHALQGVATA